MFDELRFGHKMNKLRWVYGGGWVGAGECCRYQGVEEKETTPAEKSPRTSLHRHSDNLCYLRDAMQVILNAVAESSERDDGAEQRSM